ncbi:MAG: hypothetical protein ABIF04_06580 [Chloroflexota bacterium]
MAKSKLGVIEEFGGQVENAVGVVTREQVMAGAEALTDKTNGKTISLWVRDAIDRLDALAPEPARLKIMEACGYNCVHHNSSVIARGKARRAKFDNVEAFLAAEVRKPRVGTRLERNDNVLIQSYTPTSFSHPMRCFCGLLRDLPADVQVSSTYCNCSKAFVQTYWSEVLGHPVQVTILETAVTGSTECKFKVIL